MVDGQDCLVVVVPLDQSELVELEILRPYFDPERDPLHLPVVVLPARSVVVSVVEMTPHFLAQKHTLDF